MPSNPSKAIEFKRILRQYEYSLEDLKDLKDLESHIKSEFGSALAALERHDLFDQTPKIPEESDVETIIPDTERDPAFKKLFRKVVVRCHPDKLSDKLTILQKAEKKDLYEKAIKANDDYNWAMLIIVAIKLELELPEEYYEYIENLKSESVKVSEEIETIQGSVAWKWYHTESVEERAQILKLYIAFIEKQKYENVKESKLILGLGHPRTGTGYTSNLLKTWGLDVGHEKMGADGIIAWQLVSDIEPRIFMEDFDSSRYTYKYLIYNVRDPRGSIPSIALTENETIGYRFRSLGLFQSFSHVENAVRSLLEWDKIIRSKNPDFVYRIEDQATELHRFLTSKNIEVSEFKDSDLRNKRKHGGLDKIKDDIMSLSPELKQGLDEYCEMYGYPKMF